MSNAYRKSAGKWFERQLAETLKRMDVTAARKKNKARVHRKHVEDAAVIDPAESGEIDYRSDVNTLQVEGLDFSVHESDHRGG